MPTNAPQIAFLLEMLMIFRLLLVAVVVELVVVVRQ